MMTSTRTFVGAVLAALLAIGCDSSSSPKKDPAPAATTEAQSGDAVATATAGAVSRAPVAHGGSTPQTKEVKFEGSVQWKDYDAGLKEAKASNKPVLLFVYADWCPKCRKLGPLFATPEIEKLAESFVMIRADSEAKPDWLEPLNEKYGGYVPRIFFMTPDGTVREDIVSPHPKYPYFYAFNAPEALKDSMEKGSSLP